MVCRILQGFRVSIQHREQLPRPTGARELSGRITRGIKKSTGPGPRQGLFIPSARRSLPTNTEVYLQAKKSLAVRASPVAIETTAIGTGAASRSSIIDNHV